MQCAVKKGFGFGLTSGIITTLGLIVGLHSSTHSSFVVLGGIIVIAVADALSDALGIHISEEAENKHSTKEIWVATGVTFLSKFVFAILFVIPVLLLPLKTAIIVSVAVGLSLIALFSFYLARQQKINPLHVIGEHLFIASFVIIVTHYIGDWVGSFG